MVGGTHAQALGSYSPNEKKIREIIALFPVLNSKVDILEFL
jgi:hypothetical protein